LQNFNCLSTSGTYQPLNMLPKGTSILNRLASIRSVLLILILAHGAVFLHGQNLTDLHDPFYRDAEIWQGAGFLEPLPYLQPWPAQIVVGALERMVENPQLPIHVAQRAQRYLSRLRDDTGSLQFRVDASHRNQLGDAREHLTILTPRLDISWGITDSLHLAVLGGPNLIYDPRDDALPAFRRERLDWVPDWSDFDLLGRNINIRTVLLSQMSLGNEEFGGFMGFGRTNYGPFFNDGIVLSADSPYGAYFGYTWHRPNLGVSFLYRPLTATDNQGMGKEPDKHFVFHSIEYRPASWVTLTFFESMIWGNRFELSYFVPFSGFFLTQGLGGFTGNSLMGVSAEFRPVQGVRLPITVYADDIHFNDIVRFQLDTKWKLALQTGVEWFPQAQNIPVLEFLSLDYTAVMPYMYTHRDDQISVLDPDWLTTPNFSNYTHRGENLGPGIPPNSDRIRLEARTRPLPWLTAGLWLQQVRHGNASEETDIPDPINTGDLFDPGYGPTGATFQSTTRFLIQNVLEITRQVGIQAEAQLPLPSNWPEMNIGLGYVFEHVQNSRFLEGNNLVNQFITIDFTTRF
jgi:hypothetical protein